MTNAAAEERIVTLEMVATGSMIVLFVMLLLSEKIGFVFKDISFEWTLGSTLLKRPIPPMSAMTNLLMPELEKLVALPLEVFVISFGIDSSTTKKMCFIFIDFQFLSMQRCVPTLPAKRK